jgi:hypothetical protein
LKKTSKSNLDLDMEMATYWGKEAEDEESQR